MLLKFLTEKQELFDIALCDWKSVLVSLNLSREGGSHNINMIVHINSSNAKYRKRGAAGIS